MDFLESKYFYLGLMILSVSYPLAQSFERRLKLYKNWKAIFSGIVVMMLLFIPWDIWFTEIGVWWFRDDYITGFKILNLPFEEWLFFIIVPYACIFIYEVLNYFIKKDLLLHLARPFFFFIGIALLIISFIYNSNYYTGITFSLSAVYCFVIVYWNPKWLSRFLLMYLISWIPFLLVNGALTGSFTENPVVNYNPEEIINFRIFTVPIEDSIYSLLMLFIVTSVYEYFKKSYPTNK